MIKTGDRFGVLEVRSVAGDVYLCTCLVHTDRRPMQLSAKQLETAIQCSKCAADSVKLRRNAHKMTGRTFGDYVAIESVGLSSGAREIKENQRQWRGKIDLEHSYCRHKYWRCYCRHCLAEREIRGDVLRSGVLHCECWPKRMGVI
ncbi:hypothetical protein [Neptuniibacter sp.]|uniref:hypothetical protein n=1 Tax=Neptuniibacter sp. TaxID=1962643 RepID=UPI0026195F15|nr:hypothetical protein [Neptuniibacter sp.]MCP4596246.1 hypothetical protein [Neptuniibacter sp.]